MSFQYLCYSIKYSFRLNLKPMTVKSKTNYKSDVMQKFTINKFSFKRFHKSLMLIEFIHFYVKSVQKYATT